MTRTHVRNIDELVTETAEIIYQSYLDAINKKGDFTLVLSGGNTPKFVFKELIKNYFNKIEWSNVHFFWVDERCVKPEHIDSNYKLANEYLLKYIEPGSVHRIEGELPPLHAAEEYEKEIHNFFQKTDMESPKFDLVLLGMGEDGHVASLFPSDFEKETMALITSSKLEHNGSYRVSMTKYLINQADKLLLMITNEKKEDIFLKKNNYPVHILDRKKVIPVILSSKSPN